MLPDYILAKICEAYKKTDDKNTDNFLVFIMYYVLTKEAWLNYQNREERTTPTDHYYNAETKTLTLILNEENAKKYGVVYDEISLLLPNSSDYTKFKRSTKIYKNYSYNNRKNGYEHSVDSDYWYINQE